MDLYIIGNGFDLAHDLPTSYWNFRSFLEQSNPDFLKQFEEKYDIYPGMNETTKQNLLWNQFEYNLANINEEMIIDLATSIDLGLESGDIDVEDMFYNYLSGEYSYIRDLKQLLKQWTRSIRIRGVQPRTTAFNVSNNAIFVNFNYTALLENVYGIDPRDVIHIHGSLRTWDDDPIIGHGNHERIKNIRLQRHNAEEVFDEKETSICRAIEDYYNATLKDVQFYLRKLGRLSNYTINRIVVIGHSLSGVDLGYFKEIDSITNHIIPWKVYYYKDTERTAMEEHINQCSINTNRCEFEHSNLFYNL